MATFVKKNYSVYKSINTCMYVIINVIVNKVQLS